MDAQIPATVTVRMIATLHMYRRDRGLPVRVTLEVPESGVRAAQLARELDLPLERIEGLFLNGRLVGLGATGRQGRLRAAWHSGITPGVLRTFGYRALRARLKLLALAGVLADERGHALLRVTEEQDGLRVGVERVRHAGVSGSVVEVAHDHRGGLVHAQDRHA